MRDLTTGSIRKHILVMATPITAGMIFSVLYVLVDLYFVARLGPSAVAGVGAAATVSFVVMAMTQMVSVGTVALVSHAAGRKDRPDANAVFNQAVALSIVSGIAIAVAAFLISGPYMRLVAANGAAIATGRDYLLCFAPGLGLQFAIAAMGSGLRATGVVQGPMMIQIGTVLLNILLAPILIAGWITGHPFGTAGAGAASSIAIAVGVVVLTLYFLRTEKFVALAPSEWINVRLPTWWRLLKIGIPAGGEMGLLFVYSGIIYVIIARFGPDAQAGFTVGSRLMQAFFLPVMAIAFAASPIAGQNFGARDHDRIRETLISAILISSILMLAVTLICQWRPEPLIRFFTNDQEAISFGSVYLRIISWNFIATGIIYSCSSVFQALGNTWPALFSSASRLLTFILPMLWLVNRPSFRIEEVWYLSVATVALQAVTSLVLLRRQMHRARAEHAAAPT
ncbi:MAG: MATE family efflux transporter [Alphaproteobacteria bacterium]|nr:MATE family efflux transporter [Alphaproteobacteria bacterium]